MRIIRFKNPIFHNGINYTVRRGEFWGDTAVINDYWDIRASEEQDRRLGLVAWVKVVTHCRLRDIPKSVLENFHDPRGKFIGGLIAILTEHYEDLRGMSPIQIHDQVVSCIGFVVLGE